MTYDRRTAAISLEEKGPGEYKVSGPYAEMQKVIPLLKKQRKWRFEPSDKSWVSHDLGPRQLVKVREQIGDAPVEAAGTSAREFAKFERKALQLSGPVGWFEKRPEGLAFKLWSSMGDRTHRILGWARQAGVKGDITNMVVTPETLSPKAAHALLKELSKFNEEVEQQRKERAVVRAQLETLLPVNIMGIKGALTQTMVEWTGETRPYRNLFREAGFKWSSSWTAPIAPGITSKVKSIIDQLEEAAQEAQEAAKKLGLPRSFSQIGIFVGLSGEVVSFTGNGTRTYKERLRDAGLKWDGRSWSGNLAVVDTEELGSILEEMSVADAAPTEEEVKQTKKREGRPNRRGDHCSDCGGWVEAGEGVLVRAFDDEEDRLVWEVYHQDREVCEQTKDRRRREHEEQAKVHATKREAARALREYALSKGTMPSGNNRPPGRTIMLDDKGIAYGGGYWVVIEPDERNFWYVTNNGADGDDWSRNNVQTGGAGAIGRRAPLTDEVKQWVEVISGKSF